MEDHVKTFRKVYRKDLLWQRDREIMFLSMLAGKPHFPRLLGFDNTSITIEHCGFQIERGGDVTLLADQLTEILDLLEDAHIQHRDITRHNLLLKDGTVYLIDFGWSIWKWEKFSPIRLPEVMWGMRRPDREQAADLLRYYAYELEVEY